MTPTTDQKLPLPWYLTSLATIYVLVGGWGVYQTISSGFNQPQYGLALLSLIGAGLLFRNKLSRFVALLWLVPNYVFVAAFLFSLIFVPSAVSFHMEVTVGGIGHNFSNDKYGPQIFIGLYILLTITQHLILTRRRSRQSIPPLAIVVSVSEFLERVRNNHVSWLASLIFVATFSSYATFKLVDQFVSLLAMDSKIEDARHIAYPIKLLSQNDPEKTLDFMCTDLVDHVHVIEKLRNNSYLGFFPSWALTDFFAQGDERRETGQKKIQASVELCNHKFGVR